MPSRRTFLGAGAALVGGFALFRCSQGGRMSEIRFDLNQDIVETAKGSGVPEFSVRNINGLVSYSVDGIPVEIPCRFTRKGYEISWQPLFAFTMYADRKWDGRLAVHTVHLQLRDRSFSDAEAKRFVEQTIAQFQRGQWKRYADPEWDVLLTGRSSILDESGNIRRILMTIDPAYRIPDEDWGKVVAASPTWRWVGDGVLATLEVDNSPGVDGKPAYRMDLAFELLDIKLKQDAENLAREKKKGDAKGWGTSARYEADKKIVDERNKRLIANAIERGDSVVPLTP